MSTVPISQHVRKANVQPAFFSQEQQQQNLDTVQQHILNAVNALYVEATNTAVQALQITDYFSDTDCPVFRHVPEEDVNTPAGWVYGHDGVRSYFDLLALHWTRQFCVRQSSITVDPVSRTCQFVLDIHWSWRRPGIPGWLEILECNQTYDFAYKIMRAEYITLSGRDTCWPFMERIVTSTRVVRGMSLATPNHANTSSIGSGSRTG